MTLVGGRVGKNTLGIGGWEEIVQKLAPLPKPEYNTIVKETRGD